MQIGAEMEKETKRALQRMIEIIQEQQTEIRTLQRNASPTKRRPDDGLADRIERIAQEVAKLQSFDLDWRRLCDRHYADKS
jgi:signal transduction histidine kinase